MAIHIRRRAFISAISALLGGAAVAWPLAARAQRPAKVHRIAVIHAAVPVTDIIETSSIRFYRAFFQELRRLGYVEGRNLIVERYSGLGRTEHYAELAREVVRSKPDLIFASGTDTVRHLKAATATIPIVGVMGNPVGWGLAASFAHPGGNITGRRWKRRLKAWAFCYLAQGSKGPSRRRSIDACSRRRCRSTRTRSMWAQTRKTPLTVD